MASAADGDPLRVCQTYVYERLDRCANVVDFSAARVFNIEVAEVLAVSGATTEVGFEDEVSLLREIESTNSSDSSLQFQWQWGAAVYTSWPGNAAANIEPVHAQRQAGAPLNVAVEIDLIQGPRSGGGSNFTGSWSGTGQGTCP